MQKIPVHSNPATCDSAILCPCSPEPIIPQQVTGPFGHTGTWTESVGEWRPKATVCCDDKGVFARFLLMQHHLEVLSNRFFFKTRVFCGAISVSPKCSSGSCSQMWELNRKRFACCLAFFFGLLKERGETEFISPSSNSWMVRPRSLALLPLWHH